MAEIYKLDGRRLTFGELWRIHGHNPQGFLAASVRKLLGVPRPVTFGIRRPDALDLHEPADLPSPVRHRLESAVRKCEASGYALQFFASVDALVGSGTKAYMAALVPADGLVWATATVAHRRHGGADAPRFTCFSRLSDGRYAITAGQRGKMASHPEDVVEVMDGAPFDAIAARHRERIAEPELRPVAVGRGELAGVLLSREQRHVDFQIQRGVYVPMTEEEVDRILGVY